VAFKSGAAEYEPDNIWLLHLSLFGVLVLKSDLLTVKD
jgi:hypothetical protein